jgi:hypothetical protein
MPVTSYSRTPASNNSAPPNGAPEGQTPGSVNNVIRQLMTDTVNEAAKNQAKVLSSVAGTNTITGSLTPALDAYTAGMLVVFTPAATNTGAVSLNINSLGALDVQKHNGTELSPGDLVIGVPALLLLDAGADDFILVNPHKVTTDGTYTPTLSNTTNVTSSVSAVCQWMRVGKVVMVSGVIEVRPTSGIGVLTEVGITLPVASNFAAATNLGGAGAHNSSAVNIYANVVDDRAFAFFFSSTASSTQLPFSFTYLVI